MSSKIVISASRRTDIPAFYMDWFMERIDIGFFETVNPFNRKKTIVPATTDHVHTIVFWSKNFNQFIDGKYGDRLREKGFHLFFNFTLNPENAFLEPNTPSLENRFKQAKALCKTFGPETVSWRFDPICFYTLPDGSKGNNLKGFPDIAGQMASFGIQRCITSFMDHYAKINARPGPFEDFHFIDPDISQKIRILERMESAIASMNMKLYTCCEKKVLAAMGEDTGIQSSACIPNRLLTDLFGGQLSYQKDTGQRIKQGCGCTVSRDIGGYQQHPCYHNCLYCYANPKDKEFR
jgi:hypothetical protein